MRIKDFGRTINKSFSEVKMPLKRIRSVESFCTLSTSSGSYETEIVPLKRQKGWDAYCWICHGNNTERRCSTCIRTYHLKCISTKDAEKPKSGYQCDLCIRLNAAIEDYNKRNVDTERFHEMLHYVTNYLLGNSDYSRFGSQFSKLKKPAALDATSLILNPFDLSIVMEKVDECRYETTLDYISDIRWIRHNAEIVLKAYDPRLQIARKMEDWCEKEMYEIEMCDQCFIRAHLTNTWFTQVCDPPHLLVWARIRGHPWWPAKLIGLSGSYQKKVDVRFFGGHEKTNVDPSDCILFTGNPNATLDKSEQIELNYAMEEAKMYIENIEKKFACRVSRPRSKITITLNQIDRHLVKMIPKLELPENFKLKRKPTYLKKLRRRKRSTVSPRINSIDSFVNDLIRPCEVRLEKCDNMLNYAHHGINRSVKYTGVANEEASKDQLTEPNDKGDEKGDHNENENQHGKQEQNGKEVQTEDEDQTEKEDQNRKNDLDEKEETDEQTVEEQQTQRHYGEYEQQMNSINEQNKNSELPIDLSTTSKDMNMDKSKSTLETSNDSITLFSEDETENVPPPQAKRYSNSNRNDEPYRKEPAKRTYGKQNHRSLSDKMPLLKSRRTFIARKSYCSLHLSNYAIRREKSNVTATQIVSYDLTKDSLQKNSQNKTDSASIRDKIDSGTNSDHELMDMELESINDYQLICSDTRTNSQSSSKIESHVQYQKNSDHVFMVNPCVVPKPIQSQPEAQNDSTPQSAVQNENRTEIHDLSSKSSQVSVQNSMEAPKLFSDNNDQTDVAENFNENTEKCKSDIELCSSKQSTSEPISLPTESTRENPLIRSFRLITTKMEQEIAHLKEQLKQQTEMEENVASKQREIASLKDELKQIVQRNKKLENEISLLKKAAEDEKKKELCVICKREAVISKFKPPTCSPECIRKQWCKSIALPHTIFDDPQVNTFTNEFQFNQMNLTKCKKIVEKR